jgi:hypothetical protein
MHDGNNEKFLVTELINNAVGKSVGAASAGSL